MIVIKNYTDKISGIDLYDVETTTGELILKDVDPWTLKSITRVLTYLNVQIEERTK